MEAVEGNINRFLTRERDKTLAFIKGDLEIELGEREKTKVILNEMERENAEGNI